MKEVEGVHFLVKFACHHSSKYKLFLPGPIEDEEMSPGEVIESVNEEPSGALDIETRALETPEQLLGKFLTNAQGQELAKHQY